MAARDNLRPVKGSRVSMRHRRRRSELVRLVFVPDASGTGAFIYGADDLLVRRLVRAVEVTVPEEALGALDD